MNFKKRFLKKFLPLTIVFALILSTTLPSIGLTNSSGSESVLKIEKQSRLDKQNSIVEEKKLIQKKTSSIRKKPKKSEWISERDKSTNQTRSDVKDVVSQVKKNINPSFEKAKKTKKSKGTFAPDELIVKFKTNTSADALRGKYSLKTKKKLPSIGAEVLKAPKGTNVGQLVSALKKDPSVVYAQLNYKYYPATLPNDTYFDQLWGLHNTGQPIQGMPSLNDIDIDALEAWGTLQSPNEIIVAVIDTGVDINHPDLEDNIWVNTGEIPDNGIDDDGNGYVDDVNGWDFYNGDNSVFDPLQGDEHGTHVSGTIAALPNNSLGITGIAPNVKIIPLKFIGPDGGNTADAILAIEYANQMGVKISNNSWGGSGYDQVLKEAIENSNSLFVAAAGNDWLDNDIYPTYPASYDSPNILSVAALSSNGDLSWFSNFGVNSVDIAAPGENVFSTVPKKVEVGAAAEINTGAYKAIFNGFGFENILNEVERQDAFNKALSFLGYTTTSSILLVQDDESDTEYPENYLSIYTSLLDNAGVTNYTIETVSSDLRGPDATILQNYDIVIWFTGDAMGQYESTLTQLDLDALTTYLNNGGNLLLSGQDALWLNEYSPFVIDTLHLDIFGEGQARDAIGVSNTIYNEVSYIVGDVPFADFIQSNDATFTTVNLKYPGESDYSNAYDYYHGTSMAAPHVTGVAALIYGKEPALDLETAIHLLTLTGENLSSLQGTVASGNMVNAYNAVTVDPGALNNDIPGLPMDNNISTGTLDEVNDLDDVRSIYLDKGEKVKVTLTGDTGTDFDLYLFAPNTETVNTSEGMLAYSENVGTSTESIEWVIQEAGTYYIDVFAYAGSGAYMITVESANGIGTYENDHPALSFVGPWSTVTSTSHSKGTAKELNTKGSVSFTFVGNEIEWIGFKDRQQGIAYIFIDGKLVDTPSLYSSSLQTQQSLFRKTIPYGKHTITVKWTGKRDPLGRKSGTGINVDAFEVREDLTPPAAPTDLTVSFDPYAPVIGPSIQWNVDPEGKTMGYNVYRKSSTETGFTQINQLLITDTKYIDNTAVSGTSYEYTATAVSFYNNIESAQSTPIVYVYDDELPGFPIENYSAIGSVDNISDIHDVWSIDLVAGNTYNFSFNGPADADFDYMLYPPETTSIYDWSIVKGTWGMEAEEYFSYPVTTTGTYYVVVAVFSGSGEYTIDIDSKPTVNDDNIPGTPLSGNQVSDMLDMEDTNDVYSIELNAGDTITVDLTTTATIYNDMDILLYSPSATTVNFDDPTYINEVTGSTAYDTSLETFTYTVAETGTHYINVHLVGGAGPYDLSVNVEPGTSVSEPVVTRVEDSDASVVYTDSWSITSNSVFSGGTLTQSSGSGAIAEFSFTGNGIRWIAVTSPYNGLVDVYIDDQFIAQTNLYSSSSKLQEIVFEKLDLPSGSHTIKLVRTGDKGDPSAKAANINLDAFEVVENVSTDSNEPIVTRVEDSDASVVYTDSWSITSNSVFSGGTLTQSSGSGAIAEFSFTGNGIRWIAVTSPYNGLVDVYIDDQFIAQTNLYSSSSKLQEIVFEKLDLPSGSHTIKLVRTGEKGDPSAKAANINLDAFEVVENVSADPNEPIVTRVEDNNATIVYSGSWSITSNSLFSGGTLTQSNGSGAIAEFQFTGNGIRWIAVTSPYNGLVDVYIDDQFIAQTNLYSLSSKLQQIVFEKLDLPSGSHTIKLVRTGDKGDPSAKAANINLDAFEVLE